MANITISNLSPAGSDLFMDYENFIDDLDDNELLEVNGGITPTVSYAIASSEVCFIAAVVVVDAIL